MRKNTTTNALLMIAAVVISGIGIPALSSPFIGPLPQVPTTDSELGGPGTLTATGTYTATADPDRAEIVLGVEEQASDAAVAQKAAADKMARIREAMGKLGIAKDGIETVNYDIYPRRDWQRDGQTVGYTVSHTIRVKLADLTKIGPVIDAASDAGANRIDHVGFTLSDAKRAELKKQALTQAARNAREQADAAAAGLGVKVTRVQKIDTNGADYQPYYRYYGGAMAAGMEAGAPTEIEPRSVGVSATVTVEFAFA